MTTKTLRDTLARDFGLGAEIRDGWEFSLIFGDGTIFIQF